MNDGTKWKTRPSNVATIIAHQLYGLESNQSSSDLKTIGINLDGEIKNKSERAFFDFLVRRLIWQNVRVSIFGSCTPLGGSFERATKKPRRENFFASSEFFGDRDQYSENRHLHIINQIFYHVSYPSGFYSY